MFDLASTELGQYLNQLIGTEPTLVHYLAFYGLFVLSCVFVLPGFVLTASAGSIFGLERGILLCWFSVVSGAAASFLVGRFLFRRRVEKWMTRHPRAQQLDQAVSEDGWKSVLLTRFCPVVPFRISNYAFAVTRIGFVPFVFATALGTIPSATVGVYMGLTAASSVGLQSHIDDTLTRYTVTGIAVAGVILFAAYGYSLYRRVRSSSYRSRGKAARAQAISR